MKPKLLLEIMLRDRREFIQRIYTILDFNIDRVFRRRESRRLQELRRPVLDYDLQEFEESLNEAQKSISSGIKDSHDAPIALARMLYYLCRATRPSIVVETGVGNGVTSAFILQALNRNSHGHLWSIDLPPLGARKSGALIPLELRSRWTLIRGRTNELLPGLLTQLGNVDLFLHDSLHTYCNMTFEFEQAWAKMRDGGILVSDDVQMNRAFFDFTRRRSVIAFGDKGFGVAFKGRSECAPS